MLKRVVSEGTGRRARIPGRSLAAKTGTSQKLDANGLYSHRLFYASFICYAPADRPLVTVLVTVDEPRKKGYYGGVVAAPAAREIVRRTLDYLCVPFETEEHEELWL